MRIDLKQPYKSIAALTTTELPDFAVLIGRNGAGKTQLLAALQQGHAAVPGIDLHDIELYDMASFKAPNAAVGNRNSNNFAKATADRYLLARSDDPAPVDSAAQVFGAFLAEAQNTTTVADADAFVDGLKTDIQRLPDFAVFPERHDRKSGYKKALYEQVIAPIQPTKDKRSRRRQPNPVRHSFDNNHAALLGTAMKLANKLPHELTRDDILRASNFEGGTLSNAVSQVFAAYKVDQFTWAHRRIENEPVRFDELVVEYRTKYPPPWNTLRDILAAMRDAAGDDGLFDFDFSDPETYQLHMGNYEQFSFKAEMTNRTTGAKYELDSLSSGEIILMALCLSSFNQHLGRRRPKLLLLDELDAVLHPSMVTALVTTLKSLFVAHGTKVLMTSHSAMTVAALEEPDIFRVVRTDGDVNVSRTTKSEAIYELSQGLATVDAGLRIAAYGHAKVTILTEGHNARHLKRWVQLNFPQDVHVFDELVQYSNSSQLVAYGRLLGKMNTNSQFVIVWDCDAAADAEKLRQELAPGAKVVPFAFKRRRENAIARNGIENNYDDDVLAPFSIKKVDNNDTVLGYEFPKSRKTAFANHVLQHATPEHFRHFDQLHAVVTRLVG